MSVLKKGDFDVRNSAAYHQANFPIEFSPDPNLVAEGWLKRFTAEPARAEEATRLYEELGYEVHIEQVDPNEFSEVCQACALLAACSYVTLYTRKV